MSSVTKPLTYEVTWPTTAASGNKPKDGGTTPPVDQLATWKETRALFLAHTSPSDQNIICMGDSQTVGVRSDGTADGLKTKSYPAKLIANLAAAGLRTDKSQSWFGDLNLPGAGLSTAHYDPAFLAGSGWASSALGTAAGRNYRNTTNTATVRYTPTINIDEAEVYTVQSASQGSMTGRIDVETATNINNTGADAIRRTDLTTTLGSHQINSARVSGTCNWLGAIGQDGAESNLRVLNFGWCGGSSTDQTTGATPWNPLGMVSYFAPKLLILLLGTNDMNDGTPLATTLANLQLIITAAKVSGSVIVMSPPPIDSAQIALATQDAMEAGLQTLAANNNCPFLSIRQLFGGDNATAIANGYMAVDSASHPIEAGYALIASTLTTMLMA